MLKADILLAPMLTYMVQGVVWRGFWESGNPCNILNVCPWVAKYSTIISFVIIAAGWLYNHDIVYDFTPVPRW